ncbi:MAG: glycerol kinase GlpK [Parvularcula sp.]
MAHPPLLLALDQGTTSSRAMIYSRTGEILAMDQHEFPQSYPREGWVEQDPEHIWQTTLRAAQTVMKSVSGQGSIAGLGITNQRETTLIWDRKSGAPIYPAIVWQDRRTSDHCARLKRAGHESLVQERTGLVLDPYFSATKIAWVLDHVEGARGRAERGELAFGTVDSWLLWNLTGSSVHATDATNASRTSLLNISTGTWDDDLLELFGVPHALLPEVKDCAAGFGTTAPEVLGQAIPIGGIAGDQQAAAIGQSCFSEGQSKSTYGTGCFLLVNTGTKKITSQNGLLTTIASQINGQRAYAMEGSIFTTGAGVKWLRDGLGLIDDAAETEALARSIDDTGGVYLVPAFAGLGAPYWKPDARGLICGLTQATGRAEIVRAMLESVAYQTNDLIGAMNEDGIKVTELAIDGGMVANDWLCQFIADMCDVPLVRPKNLETTALGAAALAAITAGLIEGPDDVASLNEIDTRFTPRMSKEKRARRIDGWELAVSRILDRP